jgi:hypothetical protein
MATIENEKVYLLQLVNTIEKVFLTKLHTQHKKKFCSCHLTNQKRIFYPQQNVRNRIRTIPERKPEPTKKFFNYPWRQLKMESFISSNLSTQLKRLSHQAAF